MERLYKASNLPDAHLLRDLLEEEGLQACIVNETLSSLVGELPFGMVQPEVWIKDPRDMFLARATLREYLARKDEPVTEEQRCSACAEASPSNFEVCWSCRRPF